MISEYSQQPKGTRIQQTDRIPLAHNINITMVHPRNHTEQYPYQTVSTTRNQTESTTRNQTESTTISSSLPLSSHKRSQTTSEESSFSLISTSLELLVRASASSLTSANTTNSMIITSISRVYLTVKVVVVLVPQPINCYNPSQRQMPSLPLRFSN